MIIPIEREGTTIPILSTNKSSSIRKEKKTVRITPKVTEIEVEYPSSSSNSRQSDSRSSNYKKEYSEKSSWNSNGNNSTSINNSSSIKNGGDIDSFSALKAFEEDNKRWARDDIENFQFPTLLSPISLHSKTAMREKFDSFKDQVMAPVVFKDYPTKIDTFVAESDKYVLTLDVHRFKPEELEVKVTDDSVSITGKHEERQDEKNFSSQEYSRKHTLPPGVKADDINCRFSSGGVLTISAPRKEQPAISHVERTIPIKHSTIRA